MSNVIFSSFFNNQAHYYHAHLRVPYRLNDLQHFVYILDSFKISNRANFTMSNKYLYHKSTGNLIRHDIVRNISQIIHSRNPIQSRLIKLMQCDHGLKHITPTFHDKMVLLFVLRQFILELLDVLGSTNDCDALLLVVCLVITSCRLFFLITLSCWFPFLGIFFPSMFLLLPRIIIYGRFVRAQQKRGHQPLQCFHAVGSSLLPFLLRRKGIRS
mmetsp:Transcript_8242/g.17821  ORF Transcript_8242/g.17821 Transcript_8242/m.17821 type:complete len:214 (+) Transcript_8242:174-815(+)